jgi:hypothetical protein
MSGSPGRSAVRRTIRFIPLTRQVTQSIWLAQNNVAQ